MRRALHSRTEIQRATAGDSIPRDARERGYEPRDAPAAQVAYGMVALAGLMVAGLILVGLLLWYLRTHDSDAPPPFANARVDPPPPRLLEQPVEPRNRFRHPPVTATEPPPPEIERAMRAVAARGWNEAEPPPSAQEAARDHLKARE